MRPAPKRDQLLALSIVLVVCLCVALIARDYRSAIFAFVVLGAMHSGYILGKGEI